MIVNIPPNATPALVKEFLDATTPHAISGEVRYSREGVKGVWITIFRYTYNGEVPLDDLQAVVALAAANTNERLIIDIDGDYTDSLYVTVWNGNPQ